MLESHLNHRRRKRRERVRNEEGLPIPGARVKGNSFVLPKQDKGWRQELIEVAKAMRGQPSAAIPMEESFEATRLTLEAEALSRNASLSFNNGS